MNNGPVYLVSDLHLEASRPETTALFLDFLRGPARRARALYILGDLFEAWIGDDAPEQPGERVSLALRELNQSGVSNFFIAGNRDFLIGPDYCAQAGMALLEEPFHLSPETVLMHGDQLCTDDVAYQRFRRKVRDPAWQQKILSRPIWWRRMLARTARFISRRQTGNNPSEIMDVNTEAVIDCFRRHKIQTLIHGHTHRPTVHQVDVDGRPCQRVVLGDWHHSGSAVRIDNDRIELLQIRRDQKEDIELVPFQSQDQDT
ncbi:MAG: UDP-2,3-diacylglucosamine diphosphatase [Wenzhouxiangella sp.]